MKIFSASKSAVLIALLGISLNSAVLARRPGVRLNVLGTYAAGAYNQGAAEIVAHDSQTHRLFVVNGATRKIDVLDATVPSAPVLLFSIDLSLYGRSANSVDVKNGIVAVAVEAAVKTDNGKVVFFDTNGAFINAVTVGALPDMVVFTPNGEKILVANEGEPNDDYSIDPEGSVSIIDLSNGVLNATVATADFYGFNNAVLDPSIRIFGLNANVARDLEPEYIAVSHNSKTAWVTLQENNAMGILDLKSGQFTKLVGLGFKNHNDTKNKLDASDRPATGTPRGTIDIRNWPVFGMYQPDGIAPIKYRNQTFVITANEGDARDYVGLKEEARVKDLPLDMGVFGDIATLKSELNLGRLFVTNTLGNTDADPEYEALYSFGARSFSIWNAEGMQIFDSGDTIEQITADIFPNFFNASSTNNNRDSRSPSKGPEPEGVAVGKAYGRTYAFIGLERIGGILVYDVTNPYAPTYTQYINNRNFTAATNTALAGDLAPEGLHFISEDDSPIGIPLLVVANEVSGTTTIYEFSKAD